MRPNRAGRWAKQVLTLKDDHTWKAPPGYNVFVADRGAVRFNVPTDWVVASASDCIELHDRPAPDDDCRLAVSYLRLPPLDWSELPLSQLLTAIAENERRNVLTRGEIVTVPRNDLELAFMEIHFVDLKETREAFSRIALARGQQPAGEANLQALITFDFWADDAARFDPIWAEVMRSIQLGRYVADPTAGDFLH